MTHIEGIINQVLCNALEHVYADENIVDVVMHVGL